MRSQTRGNWWIVLWSGDLGRVVSETRCVSIGEAAAQAVLRGFELEHARTGRLSTTAVTTLRVAGPFATKEIALAELRKRR